MAGLADVGCELAFWRPESRQKGWAVTALLFFTLRFFLVPISLPIFLLLSSVDVLVEKTGAWVRWGGPPGWERTTKIRRNEDERTDKNDEGLREAVPRPARVKGGFALYLDCHHA